MDALMKSSFTPPESADIAKAQNEPHALRLLLAQRRLYVRAKRWAFTRMIGLGAIAVLAPILTAFAPGLSVVAASAAGLWIFLSRTLLISFETTAAGRAAVIQELFDLTVFDMPTLAARDPQVSPEEVARLVGTDQQVSAAVRRESLVDWYPIDTRLDGAEAIAISQRANAAYAERLLWWNASIWLGLSVGWAGIAIALGVAFGLSLAAFLLGVALPVLPPLLDTFDQWRNVRGAGEERRALAATIEAVLRDPARLHVDPLSLLVWQDQLFGLRRDAPQIPNLVYAATRKKNERVMSEVARELADRILEKGRGK